MNDLVRLPHTFEEKKFNWKRAAAPAGAALILVALGWGAGARLDSWRGPSREEVAAKAAAASAEKVLRAEQAHKKEIAELRAHVDGLKSQLDAQAEKARGSESAVAALQKSLAEEKAQAQALRAKLDKLPIAPPPREAAKEPPKPPQADRTPTATIPPAAAKPVAAKPAVPPAPKRYAAYVLREVNDGVAVVEGLDGIEEVSPGDRLPGGARVQRFEKRGGGWVVVTDRGYIAPERGWD